MKTTKFLARFWDDESGAAAEYVVILAIVSTALGMSLMYLAGAISGGVEDSANLINVEDSADLLNTTGCNNQGLGTGFGGGQGGGGGQGAGSGAGNTC